VPELWRVGAIWAGGETTEETCLSEDTARDIASYWLYAGALSVIVHRGEPVWYWRAPKVPEVVPEEWAS